MESENYEHSLEILDNFTNDMAKLLDKYNAHFNIICVDGVYGVKINFKDGFKDADMIWDVADQIETTE